MKISRKLLGMVVQEKATSVSDHSGVRRILGSTYNLSLLSASFLSDWKVARVTPIYKDGARDDVSNYRPISILPVVSC